MSLDRRASEIRVGVVTSCLSAVAEAETSECVCVCVRVCVWVCECVCACVRACSQFILYTCWLFLSIYRFFGDGWSELTGLFVCLALCVMVQQTRKGLDREKANEGTKKESRVLDRLRVGDAMTNTEADACCNLEVHG